MSNEVTDDATLGAAYLFGRAAARTEMERGLRGASIAPLSGEWAGDPTPKSVAEQAWLGPEEMPDDAIEEIAEYWERGYFEAWQGSSFYVRRAQ